MNSCFGKVWSTMTTSASAVSQPEVLHGCKLIQKQHYTWKLQGLSQKPQFQDIPIHLHAAASYSPPLRQEIDHCCFLFSINTFKSTYSFVPCYFVWIRRLARVYFPPLSIKSCLIFMFMCSCLFLLLLTLSPIP